MKGYVESISVFFRKFKRRHIRVVKRNCRGVLTLHILTITLRRNLKPPGFFQKPIGFSKQSNNYNVDESFGIFRGIENIIFEQRIQKRLIVNVAK